MVSGIEVVEGSACTTTLGDACTMVQYASCTLEARLQPVQLKYTKLSRDGLYSTYLRVPTLSVLTEMMVIHYRRQEKMLQHLASCLYV